MLLVVPEQEALPDETVTFVHAPQLFALFDSVITPPPADEVLSAHARAEYVPTEGKVYAGDVAVLLPDAVRAPIAVAVRSVTVPPPFAALATWMKLEKLAPVDALPMFEIMACRAIGTDTVAVIGVTEPAVRSGARQVPYVYPAGLNTPVALQLTDVDAEEQDEV